MFMLVGGSNGREPSVCEPSVCASVGVPFVCESIDSLRKNDLAGSNNRKETTHVVYVEKGSPPDCLMDRQCRL